MMLSALLLSGCGPGVEWTRPNTSLAELQQDSAECAGLARDQAFRESFFYGPPGFAGPGYFGPPGQSFRGWGGYPFGYRDDFMWRVQRESDLRDFCLRARGYTLTPVQP